MRLLDELVKLFDVHTLWAAACVISFFAGAGLMKLDLIGVL